MKDSLLKVTCWWEALQYTVLQELKRDLLKLVKVDKAYSEMHRSQLISCQLF